MNNDLKYMSLAIKEAKIAFKHNEVPIGAVLVINDKVVTKAHNLKESKQDSTCHAEILAIRKASKKLNNWRLLNSTLYVTLEPCAMCASAIAQARISRVVFALEDEKNGAIINGVKLYNFKSNEKSPKVCHGLLRDESLKLMKEFFKIKRNKY